MVGNQQVKNQKMMVPLPRFYIIDKRTKLGLSAEEVSRRLSVSKRYYYQIENGWRGTRMGVPFILKLIEVLDINAQQFLEAENDHLKRFNELNNIKEKAR
jgi:transcriptional regulator with XRE-family HTH domain